MYGKHFIGAVVKAIGSGIAGGLLLLASQQWITQDIEFKKASRDAYISTPLGQRGLSMAYGGDSLKNVSVVEFAILNRTSHQQSDVDVVFMVNAGNVAPRLVSSGLIPPAGYPATETVEEVQTQDGYSKRYRIKIVPKWDGGNYFHGIFVFEGDKAPDMSVVSFSKDMSIVEFAGWKDNARIGAIIFVLISAFYVVMFVVLDLIYFFNQPKRHRKMVDKFKSHAADVYGIVPLERPDDTSISDAALLYGSFVRPKGSKIWERLFGSRQFDC